jgi:hypothetical protein
LQFPSNGDSSQSSAAGESPIVNGYTYHQQQQQHHQQQQRKRFFNINFKNGVRNGGQIPPSPPYAVVPSFMVKKVLRNHWKKLD